MIFVLFVLVCISNEGSGERKGGDNGWGEKNHVKKKEEKTKRKNYHEGIKK